MIQLNLIVPNDADLFPLSPKSVRFLVALMPRIGKMREIVQDYVTRRGQFDREFKKVADRTNFIPDWSIEDDSLVIGDLRIPLDHICRSEHEIRVDLMQELWDKVQAQKAAEREAKERAELKELLAKYPDVRKG